MVRRAKTLTVLAAAAAISTAVLAAPASASVSGGLTPAAGSGPIATSADESLVRYLPSGRKPVKRRIAFLGECTLDCKLFVRMTLVLPGPNVGPVNVTGTLDVETKPVFQGWIQLNRPALRALKANRREARFRTRVRAVDVVTGEVDVDRRSFRFKTG
jgi:hypothetical protein